MQTNRGIDERRQLDAAEPAFTRILLLAIRDFDDHVGLSAVVHEAEASLVADGLAELADGSKLSLLRLLRRVIGRSVLAGEDVDPNGLFAVRLRLAEAKHGAERDGCQSGHAPIIAREQGPRWSKTGIKKVWTRSRESVTIVHHSSMAWITLVVAGLFEIGWAVGLKYTDGFTRVWPTVGTAAALVASMALLGIAVRALPIGTAYAVWTGIGAAGTALLGLWLFDEPATAARLLCIGLILAGVLGLKAAS